MAGAGRRATLRDRSADPHAGRRYGARRAHRCSDAGRTGVPGLDKPSVADQPRRRLLKGAAGTVVLALATARAAHGASLLAVRVWPGRDYTRVTLEHDEPLKFSHFMLRDAPPLRLVVDVEGIVLTSQLKELVGKIDADDPYIAHVRIGQNRPDVVRLVIELKGDVAPQLYQLDPVGPYRYRLLFDLYPTNPAHPLMALIPQSTAPPQPPPHAPAPRPPPPRH